MRILYYDLIWDSNVTASSHVKEVIQNFKDEGHEVLFYDRYFSVNELADKPNTRLGRYSKISNILPLIGVLIIYIGEITRFIKVMFNIILLKDIRPDILYFRNSFLNSGYWTAKTLRIPAIKEVNGIHTDEKHISMETKGLAEIILDKIEKYNMNKADMIIVVTQKLRNILINEYYVPEDKIVVIENGANVDLFSPIDRENALNKLGLNDELRYVCFSGYFAAWQGLEYLVKCIPHVLSELPNTCFLFVGDGELKEICYKMAYELNVIDKIIFTGMVPYKMVPIYINASDLCVAPFCIQRNERCGLSPLKLCEYLACGKPVIASNINGLEILEEYNMGLLVQPEDEKSLGKAIIKLLNDNDLRNTMGSNGRKYVVENRSWNKVACSIIEVMKGLLMMNLSG